jgi:hypothetical protein
MCKTDMIISVFRILSGMLKRRSGPASSKCFHVDIVNYIYKMVLEIIFVPQSSCVSKRSENVRMILDHPDSPKWACSIWTISDHSGPCRTMSDHVGPCRTHVGPCRTHVGPMSDHVGPMSDHVGPMSDHVGPMSGHVGPCRTHVGPCRTVSDHLGPVRVVRDGPR